MTTTAHSLADRFDLSIRRVFLTGPQALVRMMILQHETDRRAGLRTAGLVTGYRGSPVGGVDQAFQRAESVLKPRNILLQPAINEDLAATALWGSQQAEMRGEGRFDGVFGMFYAKGPGVDRSGDVFRHANSAGTSKHGGVLVLAGDDHGAESSTVPHQSEFALLNAMMPVLHPAGLQELIDFGLHGLALSRFSGSWVGVKCVHDTVESAGIVEAGVDRITPVIPADFKLPPDGLNIRPGDDRFAAEKRLFTVRRDAAIAYARANGLNRITRGGGGSARFGIVAAGKSYLDVLQALDDLGIDEAMSAELGIRLLKVGMVFPLDHEIAAEFAHGLDLIMVVEEKRLLIETNLREALFNEPQRARVIGKDDEDGAPLFPAYGTLEPNQIAREIARRITGLKAHPEIRARAEAIADAMARAGNAPDLMARVPYFCAGCPHNSSTVLPDGARGYAGIGCHWMVQFVPGRHTEGATHMGGEGANWIGEAPFSTRKHVFQNLGDGTYNHSGLLAIRAAVAADATITYKILYNDAVAMTGGQAHDGKLSVPMIAHQLRAEGIDRIAVVSDEPGKYASRAAFPSGATFHHRDDLQELQTEFMALDGVTAIIYDQTCAAEKRRRRKRGTYPDPDRRVFINEAVCEGCGDCGVKSNCVAVAPVETAFGRKRQIDQSACNKDFSCLKGFCPSFVTIEGAELVRGTAMPKPAAGGQVFPVIAEPTLLALARPWEVLITGIGGTGVVTIGHILGQAAHIAGLGAAMIDMAGLSQKNGAVVTHLKIARRPEDIAAVRVAAGHADLILGCDLVTSASERILSGADGARTHAVINTAEVMPAQFTHNADLIMPGSRLRLAIAARVRKDGLHEIDATRLATALLGDTIAANLFTLGFAWQKGLIPIPRAAIEEAIRLNGAAVTMNLDAFIWGRRAAEDPRAVEVVALPDKPPEKRETLDEMIARLETFLTRYQNSALAAEYRACVDAVRAAEAPLKSTALTTAVARNLAKLMAYKDEYEVARLFTAPEFSGSLARRFKGGRISFHLSPPLLAPIDPQTGHPRKLRFGPWVMPVFHVLARLKFLRGSAFDPVGRTAERRRERALIGEYRAVVTELLAGLNARSLARAVEIAELPQRIRGYGHVKERNLTETKAREAELLTAWRQTAKPQVIAAE